MTKITIPVMHGADPEHQKQIGEVTLEVATKKQERILNRIVLLPNYDIGEDGHFIVSSYSMVARTDVLKANLLKKVAVMEERGLRQYDKLRSTDNGAGTDGDAGRPDTKPAKRA